MDLGGEQVGREDHTPPAAKVSVLMTSTQETDLDNVKKIACPSSQFPPRCNAIGRFGSVYHTTPINF